MKKFRINPFQAATVPGGKPTITNGPQGRGAAALDGLSLVAKADAGCKGDRRHGEGKKCLE